MKEYISSQEAFQIAKEKKQKVDEQQMSQIIEEITRAVNKGEYETRYYSPIRKDVMKNLMDLGYKIIRNKGQYNEEDYTIRWNET